MLKKLSVAALVAAMSVASVPMMTSVAQAQGGANEPPTAPTPTEAGTEGSKGSMSKGSMSSSKSMKKSKKHSMKKHM